MKFRIMFLLSLLAILTGCASRKPDKSPPVVNDHALVQLAEAANSVSTSLVELSRIQEAATPPIKGKQLPDPTRLGVKGVASVDWAGPIGPLVHRITKAADYRLRVLGKVPAVPIIVTIAAKNAPIGDLLRDIDYQAGHRAHIKVIPKTKVVELRYADL